MKSPLGIFAAAMLLSSCASPAPEADDDLMAMMFGVGPERSAQIASGLTGKPLGSEANPIRADMPPGQRSYLNRLRCANGSAPTHSRIGSMGIGPYGSVVDGYEVLCTGSSPARSVLILDMYHPGHVEGAAPPGFTITP